METCPTVKEVTMPGCYSGVLKVNTGLAPGTFLYWRIGEEGTKNLIFGSGNVDDNGDLTITGEISYFNSYKLRLKDIALNPVNIKGYDCYRLLPVKNANEVVDVII